MTRIRVRAPGALVGEQRSQARTALIRALLRSSEHSWKATEGPHQIYYVPSASQPRVTRFVEMRTGADGVLWADCSCPSGYWRGETANEPLPIVCWHAAAVLTLLFRQKRVVPLDGLVAWKGSKR